MAATTNNLVETTLSNQAAQQVETANAAFEAIDKATRGMGTAAIADGTTALTATEAKPLLIKLEGALTEDSTATVPDMASMSRPFLVWNATTGGFGVTFKTVSGTGALVEAGAIAFCWLGTDGNMQLVTGGEAAVVEASYLDRANHTGTQTASTISDLQEFVEDLMNAALLEGDGISIAYNDTTGKITITNSDHAVIATIQTDITDLQTDVATLDAALSDKADAAATTAALALKADADDVDTALALKQDVANLSNDMATDTGSTTKYPSVAEVESYVAENAPAGGGVGPDIYGVTPDALEPLDAVAVTGVRLIKDASDPIVNQDTYIYLDGVQFGVYYWNTDTWDDYNGFTIAAWDTDSISFIIPSGFVVETGTVTVSRSGAGSDSFVAGSGAGGEYTVDDTLATPASTGTLTQLLSWIAGRIKAITGKSSWLTAPAITLEALNAHKNRHKSGGADAFTSDDLIEAVVKRLQTSTGPTTLSMGAVADGEFLKRVGSAIVGADAEAGSGGGTIPGASINTTEFVLPAANAGGGAAVHSGYLYIFGGAETTTRRREIATGNWTTLSAIPALVSQIGHAIVDGIIYVAGGVVGGSPVNTLYSYNIATDTWSTLATMPADRTAGSLSASATHLYFAGGYNGSSQSGFYAYDIGANSWSTKTSLPSANHSLASTVFGGDVYIAGGVVGGTTNAAYRYSIAGDTWSSALATMPSSREGQEHLWEQDGVLFYIGGYNGSPQPNVYGYNISGNAWSEYPSLPVNINGPMIADAGSIAYIVGGNDGSGALDSVYYITTSDSPSALVGGMINGGSLGSLKGKMKAYDVNGNLIGIVAIYNS